MLSLFANPSDPDYMALHLLYAVWIFGVSLLFGAALLSAGFERKVEQAIWIANTAGCAVCLSATYLPWTNTWWAEQFGWRGLVEDILYIAVHAFLLYLTFWLMRCVRVVLESFVGIRPKKSALKRAHS